MMSNAKSATNNLTNTSKTAQNDNFCCIDRSKIPQYIEELNRIRGTFISNYAKYEFALSKLFVELLPVKIEGVGLNSANTTSQKSEALIKFVESQKKNSKQIIDSVEIIRDVKKYETLRNCLAHGVAEILFDENAHPFFVLKYFLQGINPKIECQIISRDELKKMTNDFKSLVTKIV